MDDAVAALRARVLSLPSDLKAMFAYLRTVAKVRNKVPEARVPQ